MKIFLTSEINLSERKLKIIQLEKWKEEGRRGTKELLDLIALYLGEIFIDDPDNAQVCQINKYNSLVMHSSLTLPERKKLLME